MSNTFKIYDGEIIVSYKTDNKIAQDVVKKIIEWCEQYNVNCGEGLMQSDEPQIEAPALIAEIIDDLLQFESKYEGE